MSQLISNPPVKNFLVILTFLFFLACTRESIISPETDIVAHSGMRTNVTQAFFVSPEGKDSNSGTLESPFLTFERARDTLRVSSIKTVYIRSGLYQRTNTFFLDAKDNNQVWSIYPGDIPNTAIINGNGIHDILDIIGGSGITINGLTIQNFSSRGIGIHGGMGMKEATPHFTVKHDIAEGNKITNNIVENGNVAFGAWDRAAIYAQGNVPNTYLANNVIRNSTGYGMGVWCLQTGDNTSNTQIINNVLLNVCGNVKDGGAIYINDRTRKVTGIVVKNNYIRDYGIFENATRAIYMDDESSNLTVEGNIISGSGTYPIMYHSGSNNKVTGNIIDLNDDGTKSIFLYQNDSNYGVMSNNVFSGNIILSKYTFYSIARVYKFFDTGRQTNKPDIKNNFYYNYTTGTINTGNTELADSSPITGDPEIYGWNYDIKDTSPIYKSPINFPNKSNNWGPVGYTIPTIGTAPSCLISSRKMLQITANKYDSMQGVTKNNTFLGSCDNNDWVAYNNVDLGSGYSKLTIRVAVPDPQAGQIIEVRSGSVTGSLLGMLKTVSTGSFTSYEDQSINLNGAIGTHKIYIVFKGKSGIGNFEYFRFTN